MFFYFLFVLTASPESDLANDTRVQIGLFSNSIPSEFVCEEDEFTHQFTRLF